MRYFKITFFINQTYVNQTYNIETSIQRNFYGKMFSISNGKNISKDITHRKQTKVQSCQKQIRAGLALSFDNFSNKYFWFLHWNLVSYSLKGSRLQTYCNEIPSFQKHLLFKVVFIVTRYYALNVVASQKYNYDFLQ